jgi:hypothetical protein
MRCWVNPNLPIYWERGNGASGCVGREGGKGNGGKGGWIANGRRHAADIGYQISATGYQEAVGSWGRSERVEEWKRGGEEEKSNPRETQEYRPFEAQGKQECLCHIGEPER